MIKTDVDCDKMDSDCDTDNISRSYPQPTPYAHLDLVERFRDDVIASRIIEERYVLEENPIVLDAGSMFYDKDGNKHADACAFLAIHAAVHLYYKSGIMVNDELITRMKNGEFEPIKLKQACEFTSFDDRVEPSHLDRIGIYMKCQILVHSPGGIKERYGIKKKRQLVIHLYHALSHYTVCLFGVDLAYCRWFVTGWWHLGYQLTNLADQCADELSWYDFITNVSDDLPQIDHSSASEPVYTIPDAVLAFICESDGKSPEDVWFEQVEIALRIQQEADDRENALSAYLADEFPYS